MLIGSRPKRTVSRFAVGDRVKQSFSCTDTVRYPRGGKIVGFIDNEDEFLPIRVRWVGVTCIRRYKDSDLDSPD